MKFQVGEVVKFKDDLDYLWKHTNWNHEGKMDYLAGQVFTIKSHTASGCYRSVEGIENNRGGNLYDYWYIDDPMLEPVISDDLEINSIKTFNSIFG